MESSEPEMTDYTDDDWSDSYESMHKPSRSALSEEADRKHDAIQNMASRPRSLSDDLNGQLAFLDLEPVVRELASFIINNLDENGYLSLSLEEVVADFPGNAKLEDAEEALRTVQKLDPPGIGARNLRECLLLQLTPETPFRDILQALVSNHLEDLQQNRLPVIERKTGVPLETIKEAIDQLRRLNPRPGAIVARPLGVRPAGPLGRPERPRPL